MRILGTKDLSQLTDPLVVTIGNLDGVHIGHQALLRTVVETARERGALPAAITFLPHPLKVLLLNPDIKLLTRLEDKQNLISRLGIELLIRMQFDEELAKMSARGFLQEHFCQYAKLSALVVGHNCALGHKKEADPSALEQIGHELGFEVIVVPPVLHDEMVVSSTRVRECLVNGHIGLVGSLLGRPYDIVGKVAQFSGRGRVLGFPTANLVGIETLQPQNGVYITQLKVEGTDTWLPSATNIGHHPTFYSERATVETHIIDSRVDLYGKEVRLAFLKRLRPERRFSNREKLISQICADINVTRAYFRERERPDAVQD